MGRQEVPKQNKWSLEQHPCGAEGGCSGREVGKLAPSDQTSRMGVARDDTS